MFASRRVRVVNGVAFEFDACIVCAGIEVEIEIVNAGSASTHIPVRSKRAVRVSTPGINGSA